MEWKISIQTSLQMDHRPVHLEQSWDHVVSGMLLPSHPCCPKGLHQEERDWRTASWSQLHQSCTYSTMQILLWDQPKELRSPFNTSVYSYTCSCIHIPARQIEWREQWALFKVLWSFAWSILPINQNDNTKQLWWRGIICEAQTPVLKHNSGTMLKVQSSRGHHTLHPCWWNQTVWHMSTWDHLAVCGTFLGWMSLPRKFAARCLKVCADPCFLWNLGYIIVSRIRSGGWISCIERRSFTSPWPTKILPGPQS